jgi:hypothetical protein
VTVANYIFLYEIFIDGNFTESCAGKVDFCVMPGEDENARVVFTLTKEGTQLVKVVGECEKWLPTNTEIEMRIIVMEAATMRTAMIFPKHEHICTRSAEDGNIQFE